MHVAETRYVICKARAASLACAWPATKATLPLSVPGKAEHQACSATIPLPPPPPASLGGYVHRKKYVSADQCGVVRCGGVLETAQNTAAGATPNLYRNNYCASG
eukprot:366458-Chlamydomonas_euryale.AAC.21